MTYIIEYASKSTDNGKPVGRVYLQNVDSITLVPDTWSYTRNPREATAWPTEDEAHAFLAGRRYPWPEANVIEQSKAEVIKRG